MLLALSVFRNAGHSFEHSQWIQIGVNMSMVLLKCEINIDDSESVIQTSTK